MLPTSETDPSPAVTSAVTVERLVYGGMGLVRQPSGEVVFVQGALPGESVILSEAPVQLRPKVYAVATRLQSSPNRVTPECSVFETCGGCHWQDLAYPQQLHWKQEIVAESFRRIAKVAEPPVREILASPEGAWRYRNKVQWVAEPKGAPLKLGYHPPQSHDVVGFEDCKIIPAPFNDLARWLEAHCAPESGLQSITVRQNSDGQWLVGFAANDDWRYPVDVVALAEAFPQLQGVVFERSGGGEPQCLWGQDFLMERGFKRPLKLSYDSFFQTNFAATHQILSLLENAMMGHVQTFGDLYGGVGLFSIALADLYKQGYIVEMGKTAVEDAQHNLTHNGLSHIEVIAADVKAAFAKLPEVLDVVLVDPPRAGCDARVVEQICKMAQQQILYLSCDPTTLARDCKLMLAQGWKLDWIQPVEMFPQTYHVETLACLSRASSPSRA